MSRKSFRDAWRSRLHGRDAEPSVGVSLLALAAGVVVGAVAGAYLADRLGGVAGIKTRFRTATGRRRSPMHNHDNEAATERAYVGHHDAMDDDLDDEAYEEEAYVAEYERENEELEERVLDAFSNDPVLSERAVDIGAIGPSTIELSGWVHTKDELTHAATIARGVPGVSNVVNDLSVRTDEQSPPSAP